MENNAEAKNLLGKISKINREYSYGFITCKQLKDIFFSNGTNFINTSLDDLEVSDAVKFSVKMTDRGPFAKTLEKRPPARSTRTN